MKSTLLILLLIFFYQLNVQAQDDNVIEFFKRDIARSVRTIDSNIALFHYFKINTNSYKTKDLKQERNRNKITYDHINNSALQFFNTSNHRTTMSNVGLGLYLAIDPFISSPEAEYYSRANFGDSMIELIIRSGTRYLSVKKKVLLSPMTITLLIKNNVISKVQSSQIFKNNYLSQDTLKKMANPKYKNLRKFIINLLSSMNITLIEYEWLSSLQMFCNFKRKTSAFLYIGKNHLNIIQSTLILKYPKISKLNLNDIEMNIYQRNKKLKKTLMKLKSFEYKLKYSKAQKRINKNYNSKNELLNIKRLLYKCL